MSQRRRADAAIALAAAAIAALTLGPATAPGSDASGIFQLSFPSLSDLLRNIALFAPLGAALVIRGAGWPGSIGACVLFSALLEAVQLGIPGRYAGPWDVLANGVGAAIGALWATRVWRLATIDRGGLRISAGWAMGGAAGVLLGTSLLATPVLPETRYYGHWVPRLPHFDVYTGQIDRAVLEREPVPHGALRDPAHARAVLANPYELALDLRKGLAPADLVGLVLISDERNREILLVGLEAEDLVVRYWDRAAMLQLEPRLLRADEALAGIAPGTLVHVRLRRKDDRFELQLDDAPPRPLGSTLGSGWALFTPGWHIGAGARAFLGAAWLALVWLGPGVAYRAAPGPRVGVAALAVLMLVAPGLGFLMPTPVWEWLGAAIGFGAGRLVRRGRAWASEAPDTAAGQSGEASDPAVGQSGEASDPPR